MSAPNSGDNLANPIYPRGDDSQKATARRWNLFNDGMVAAPAIILVALCSVVPLLWMLIGVATNPDVRTELLLTSFRAKLLGRTIGYNTAAAVIATAIGLPAGYVLGRGRGWMARVLWVVI